MTPWFAKLTESQVPDWTKTQWGLFVWFALTAGAFALVATFSRIDDGRIALMAWGGFLVLLSAGHTVWLWRHGRGSGAMPWWVGHALSGVIIGVTAIALASSAAVEVVLWAIAVWAFLAGSSDVFLGLRSRGGSTLRADWLVVGVSTILLGLATLVEPLDVVWLMGTAGAWAAIVAVFTAISAIHTSTSRSDDGHTKGA